MEMLRRAGVSIAAAAFLNAASTRVGWRRSMALSALRWRSIGVAARYAVCAASSRQSCASAIFAHSGTNQATNP